MRFISFCSILAILLVGVDSISCLAQENSDPLAKLAPAECDSFFGFAGNIKLDPDGTAFERWLAQEEIQDLYGQLTELAKGNVEFSDLEGQEELTFGIAKIASSSPWAIYSNELNFESPNFRFVVELAENQKLAQQLMEKFKSMDIAGLEKFDVNGMEVFVVEDRSTDQKFEFALTDKYFLLATGDNGVGDAEEMLKGLNQKTVGPPQWYQKLSQQMPLDRVCGVFFVSIGDWIKKAGDEDTVKEFYLDDFQKLSGVFGFKGDDSMVRVSLDCPADSKNPFLKALNATPVTTEELNAIPESIDLMLAGKFDLKGAWAAAEKIPSFQKEMDSFANDFKNNVGMDFEADVIEMADGLMVAYQKISMFNPAGGAVSYVKVADPEKMTEKLPLIVETLNDQFVDDFFIDAQETRNGMIYSMLPANDEFQVAPTLKFGLFGEYLYFAADDKAISSHLRKAKKSTGKIVNNERFKMAMQSNRDDGMGDPIIVHYFDMKTTLEVIYSIIPVVSEMSESPIDLDAFPPIQVITNGIEPNVMAVYKTDEGFQMVERMTLPGIATTTPLIVGVTLPAIQQVRMAARKAMSANNLRQLQLSLLNYESSYLKFPPAYTKDDAGRKLLSWRVHILPYLGYDDLYRQFKLDEPWNSDHNIELLEKMPEAFLNPGVSAQTGYTTYLGVYGPNAALVAPEKASSKISEAGGVSLASISDGSSNTLMLVEVNEQNAVPWTKPADFEFGQVDDFESYFSGVWPDDTFKGAHVDGSVFDFEADAEDLKDRMTRNGGEVLQW